MFAPSLVLLAIIFVSATRGAVDFKCMFSTGINWVVGNVYQCQPKATIVGDSQLLESVQGTHWSGKTNDDVKVLRVINQNLPFIPGNIKTFFKNLISLSWVNSNLATISVADLKQFPKLLVFSATSNKLVSIDGDLLQHTPKLRFVNFGYNEIQHVGHNLVKDLNDLVTIYFRGNPCIDVQARDNRAAVLLLNDQLPVSCPPLATTTTENPQQQRMASAEIKLSKMNSQVVELKEQNADLKERNANQDATINDMNAKIIEQNNEIKQLTEKLRDLERKGKKSNFGCVL